MQSNGLIVGNGYHDLRLTAPPVDYPLRFSGSVTPHRPPRPAWRRTPTSSARSGLCLFKDALVPRRFSNNSLLLSPHSSTSCTAPPGRASGRIEVHLLSAAPPSPPPPPLLPNSTDTTRPVGIMPQRDRLALIRSTPRQHCLLDRLTRASTLAQ